MILDSTFLVDFEREKKRRLPGSASAFLQANLDVHFYNSHPGRRCPSGCAQTFQATVLFSAKGFCGAEPTPGRIFPTRPRNHPR